MKNKSLYRLFTGMVCFTGLIVLHACNETASAPEHAAEAVAEEPAALEVVTVQKGRLSSQLTIPGELIPYHDVDLYAKENSFVKKVYVDVGDEVKQGQLLVSLEAPEVNSRLAETQSRLRAQEAVYAASKASYDRLYETSKTPGTISPNDLEQAAAQKNAQMAQLQAARSVYNQVLDTRNYLQIRAPFSGVISVRNVSTGAYVGPSGKGSDLPLFVLQQQKKLRLVVSVPEAFTGLLKENDAVNFTVKSMPSQQFKAKVSRLAGTLDLRLRSERVEMDVDNNDKRLLPGMYAEVKLPLKAGDSTFIVPKTAVVSSTEKVFVVKVTGNKAVWLDAKKGRESGDNIEIYADLNPGDTLVKTATDEIRNGSEIKRVKKAEE